MKYIKQFSIILIISLIGEIIHLLVPFPVPASIYGLLLLLAGLKTKLVPLDSVKETSLFLIDIMPIMFIPAAVGLLDSWAMLRPILIPFIVITLVSTILVMASTGIVTQFVMKFQRKRKEEKHE